MKPIVFTLVAIPLLSMSACLGSGSSGGALPLLEDGGTPDAAAAGDSSAIDRCPGVPFETNGVRDFDLARVKVRGAVTLSGGAIPTNETFSLRFTNEETSLSTSIAWRAGAANYAVTLSPGKYTVAFEGGACTTTSKMPCVGGTLQKGIVLSEDGVLDLDIPAVTIEGNVTFDGKNPGSSEGELGRMSFLAEDGRGSAVASLTRTGTTAPAHYRAVVLAGKYTPSFIGRSSCALAASVIPCNGGVVGKMVDARSSGVVDFDVPTASVQGAVTFSGETPPNATYWGTIAFAPPPVVPVDPHGPEVSAALLPIDASSKTPRYRGIVVRGTYDVRYLGSPSACAGGAVSPTPCNEGTVQSALAVDASGVVDVDVPTVTVQGAVTANGAAPVDDGLGLGVVSFRTSRDVAKGESATASGSVTVPIGEAASYHVTLVAGTYDVGYAGVNARCATLAAAKKAALPCNGGDLKTKMALTQAGTLDIDVPVVRVEGLVNMDGKAMVDGKSDRGILTFEPTDKLHRQSASSSPLGITGIPDYGVALLSGEYAVSYAPTTSSLDPFPRNGGVVHEPVHLDENGTLDVSLETVSVSGLLTLSGGELPKTELARGVLSFLNKQGSSGVPKDPLGLSGAASYTLRILKGTYVVTYDANADLCRDPGAPSELPCIDVPLAGCDLPK